jgi:superfamily II DNA or RNA helicase
MLLEFLYDHQKKAIEQQKTLKKCLINMWCGTGKTRTFTIDLFINNQNINILVFPSLGLINQYCNDYILSLEEPFNTEFQKFKSMAFCSDDDGKLKSQGEILFTTNENSLFKFIKKKDNKILLVTYQSFEKFINVCIKNNVFIDNLIFDEAHHILSGTEYSNGDKKGIKYIVFNNQKLDAIVDKTRYYTATPVNKNGITMYDREEPENSDCGQLAHEYLYYQAVEEGICKSFETQISLYMQKPEYKSKFQPIFETIIRTCLSGKYNYWNILTYHSYVDDEKKNKNMSDNSSFVNEFASPKNQTLVKQLFTRIQNQEFPDTKDIYSVENIILKGVHSTTPRRQQIIEDFDRKVEGRIYILSSCGILNEGIDTKWANMGVPINPTKSIVKESQRIGRLVRIPEPNMTSAIILIPCEIDVTKYSSMDTPEQRDQMIREQLSESGNFNTALNVISAFKYQYDSDLFEMCLRYPNMYAPQEVKDNLNKYGLIVEESKGDLIDNLKYVCEKEDIELNLDSFENNNDSEILKNVSEFCDKTIEIHTQNHDQPIKYINQDSIDDEPLRLFYCEDDKIYSPIVKKDKKQRTKRKSINPPKKRPKLFDVHQHPDLEVLWKIKESSIDLNKTFCQGVLDVDINWNQKKWYEKLEKVKEFMDENGRRPSHKPKNPEEKVLYKWLVHQITNYNKKQNIMKNPEIYDIWTEFINNYKYKEYFTSNEEQWKRLLAKVKQFMDENHRRPINGAKNYEEMVLATWNSRQITNYTKKQNIMKNPEIYNEWTEFINDEKYKEYFISNEEQWKRTLAKVKEFIDENHRRPIQNAKKQDEKVLGLWIGTQLNNYTKKRYIMKDNEIYNIWTEFINDERYKKYFISNEEQWKQTFEKLKEFMDENEKRPSSTSQNSEEKFLGCWIGTQLKNYTMKKEIMKIPEIYNIWSEFINDDKYKEYFISNEEQWKKTLEKLKEFMDENEKRPSSTSQNPDEKVLGVWIGNQLKNYTMKKEIMKIPEIYNTWTEFINDDKYKDYFMTNEEKWKQTLAKVKEFMDEQDKRPSSTSKNPDEKFLGRWVVTQIGNYTKKQQIMENPEIYDTWTEFINDEKYKEYFISNEELWKQTLAKVKEFMDENHKRPSSISKNPDEKFLGAWIFNQIDKYKKKQRIMKNTKIYNIWTVFINDDKYKEYFINNEENWKQTLAKLKEFMDENHRRPSSTSKNPDEKFLGRWVVTQIGNYTKKEHLMKIPEIYKTWTEFINDDKYKDYFMSNEDKWKQTLAKVKEFMDENHRRPIQKSKNPDEKVLGRWISGQLKNYTKKQHIMKDPEIYNIWTEFINDDKYKEYFMSNEELWKQNLDKVKVFMDENGKKPNQRAKNPEEKVLCRWICTQIKNYTKKQNIMKIPEIYDTWTQFINDPKYSQYFQTTKTIKDMSKPEIKPKKTEGETKEQKQQRVQNQLSQLHQEYKIKNSENLNNYFKEHPEKWVEYHKIAKDNDESYPKEEIPRNKMINYLENLPGKKEKIIADLGCGFAEINQHFQEHQRFKFHNFDHHSDNELVISKDIKNTELEDYSIDIAILSLAMWGSNCKEYLEEAYRILDTGGTLLISEPYKRWNKDLDPDGNPINRLVKLLEQNNFTIIDNLEQKFMFIECRKN